MKLVKNDGRLAVLYLWYPQGNSYKKDKPLGELKRILARFECEKTIIYIDNAAINSFVTRIADNEYEISGDNTCREFSGWQKGIDFVKSLKVPIDACLFVNDMFVHDSVFYKHAMNQAAFEKALKYDAVLGTLKKLPVRGEIGGIKINGEYIRTHMFMVSTMALARLGSLVGIASKDIDSFLLSCYDEAVKLFRKDAPVSGEIKDFIFNNITSVWHNKKPYTQENFECLKGKAWAILNSLLFSARMCKAGYALMDTRRDKAAPLLGSPDTGNFKKEKEFLSIEDINEETFMHM